MNRGGPDAATPPARRAGGPPALPFRARPVNYFRGWGLAGVAAGGGAALAAGVPALGAYLAGVNAATGLLYLRDKLGAGRGWVRVPERVLHGFALAGGTPAALLAQRVLRHKTAKAGFRRWTWLSLVAQAAAVAWLATR